MCSSLYDASNMWEDTLQKFSERENYGRNSWVPTLPLISCVTLDKSLHFSEPQFSTSKMRNVTAPTSLSF